MAALDPSAQGIGSRSPSSAQADQQWFATFGDSGSDARSGASSRQLPGTDFPVPDRPRPHQVGLNFDEDSVHTMAWREPAPAPGQCVPRPSATVRVLIGSIVLLLAMVTIASAALAYAMREVLEDVRQNLVEPIEPVMESLPSGDLLRNDQFFASMVQRRPQRERELLLLRLQAFTEIKDHQAMGPLVDDFLRPHRRVNLAPTYHLIVAEALAQLGRGHEALHILDAANSGRWPVEQRQHAVGLIGRLQSQP